MADFLGLVPTKIMFNDKVAQVTNDGELKVKGDMTIADGTEIKITDGTNDLAINAQGAAAVEVKNTSIAVTASDLDIRDLSAASDSILIKNGNNALAINGDGAASVNVTNASIAVTASDLDIRDLSAANDSVAIKNGSNALAINGDGAASVNVTNTSLAVTASDLDIRDLSAASDSVAIKNGNNALAINGDGAASVNITNTSVVVSATDLDIRNLAASSDSVKIVAGSVDVKASAAGYLYAKPAPKLSFYSETENVAANASTTKTLVGNETLNMSLHQVLIGARGAVKVVIKEAGGNTKAVFFQAPSFNQAHMLDLPFAANTNVEIIVTNLEGDASNIYVSAVYSLID